MTTRTVLWLLVVSGILWMAAPVQAQLLRNNVYGTLAEEEGGRLLALRNGGYLVFGRQQPNQLPGRFYLLRLNAQGDTLWSRRHAVAPFDVLYAGEACENSSGQILLSGFGVEDNSTSGTDGILMLLNAQGDSLWTRTTRGPTSDGYTSLLLAPDGNFVVSAKLNNAPQWLKISATGQVLQSAIINYSSSDIGGILTMQPVTGGYWLICTSDNFNNPKKAVYVNANGIRGVEKLFPSWASSVYHMQLLTTGEYGIASGGRLALYNAQMDSIWSRRLTSRNIVVGARLVRETAQGNLLVLGQRFSNQQEDVSFILMNRQGIQLHDTTLTRGAGLNSNEYGLGLALDPLTGNYVFSGYVPQGPIGGADLFVGILRRFNTVLATKPARQQPTLAFEAWPNPLTRDELHLRASQPLTGLLVLRDALGRRVRSWPAARTLAEAAGQELNLQGVPAGVYLLTGSASDGRRYVARVLRK